MNPRFFQRSLVVTLSVLISTVAACRAQDGSGQKQGATSADRALINDDIASSRSNAITRAVSRVAPAVVGITVTEVREVQYQDPFEQFFNDPFFDQFFRHPGGQTLKQEIHGLGSGYIISSDGYVVTNDHVAGSASKIVVTTVGGKRYDARIIGTDPTSDVALLKIDGSNLPYLELGNSDDVMVGEWAIALGNPFGLFDINSKPTVTVGVVSNSGVNLQVQDNRVYRNMIQTDAAISSGNSGGPLVNSLGQVIGMNTVIYSTAQSNQGAGSIGIGFAVPINRVKQVIAELRSHGSIDRNFWTGMRIQQIDANIARYLHLSSQEGVVVVDVAPNSPASRAGLEVGDVIVSIGSEQIRTEDDAVALMSDARVGDSLTLRMLRDGKQFDATLKLTKRGT
jgi:serine protease Do